MATDVVTSGSLAGYSFVRASTPATRFPRVMKRLALIVLSVSLAACSIEKSAVTDVDTRQENGVENQVTAERVPDGVRVTNGSSVEIRYLVKNAAWLGLLAGCHNEPTTCATLGPGQSAVMKSASIYGHQPDANGLEVWYWVKGDSDTAGKSIYLD